MKRMVTESIKNTRRNEGDPADRRASGATTEARRFLAHPVPRAHSIAITANDGERRTAATR